MSYNVKLEIFEGPLDLLLFFIQRDEINIYDIPISEITREYMEYLDVIQQAKMNIAGEFLEIAAVLMRIKVKMILPDVENETEEMDDPRNELVDMLIEYKKFKDAATNLRILETKQSIFRRANIYQKDNRINNKPDLRELSIYDIGLKFKKVLKNMPFEQKYEIKLKKITITGQIQFVKNFLLEKSKFKFNELIRNINSRIEAITTFLAILEMIKDGIIKAVQKNGSAELLIIKMP